MKKEISPEQVKMKRAIAVMAKIALRILEAKNKDNTSNPRQLLNNNG
ncbi:MAG: hypothetical protein K6T66_12325 [Peptococcaceae bacterium]|nr:hypothetical protein [Peptococcaceae bacterium]